MELKLSKEQREFLHLILNLMRGWKLGIQSPFIMTPRDRIDNILNRGTYFTTHSSYDEPPTRSNAEYVISDKVYLNEIRTKYIKWKQEQ